MTLTTGTAPLTLNDLIDPADLQAEIDGGWIARRTHPTLPLSIYTYTRASQTADNPMQALNHARMAGRLRDVQWAVGDGEPQDGRPVFNALLTVRRPDGTQVQAGGAGGTKKAAKAAAAAELMKREGGAS